MTFTPPPVDCSLQWRCCVPWPGCQLLCTAGTCPRLAPHCIQLSAFFSGSKTWMANQITASRSKQTVMRGGGHMSGSGHNNDTTAAAAAGHQLPDTGTCAPSAAATSRVPESDVSLCAVPNISAVTEQGLLSRAQPFVSL